MSRCIDIELNDFSLPEIVHKDKDYYIKLVEYLNEYLNHVMNIKWIDDKCKGNTKENITLIVECLRLYNNAKISDAKECIKKITEKYYKASIIVTSIDNNYAFRGVALKDI